MQYKAMMAVFVMVSLAACQSHHANHSRHHAGPERLHAVQERGGHVMPFDLEKTVHVFTKIEQGGVQKVVAKDPADSEQIGLIRDHLKAIQEQFARRDFSGPAFIHGEDGAEIHYTSPDSEIREAIHRWFDAQLSDHARHAVPELE